MSVKTILQGRPFGHPLHPLMVHLPLGLWLMGVIMDCVSWFAGNAWAQTAATACIALGTGIAILAVIPGFADFLSIRDDHPAQKTALAHMALMVPAVAIFIIDSVLHYFDLANGRHMVLPTVLSFAGYALAISGGYLGGRLVYDDGIGPGRHRRKTSLPQTTFIEPPPEGWFPEVEGAPVLGDFVPLVPLRTFESTSTVRGDIEGTVVVLVKTAEGIFAVQEFCTHRCGPLSEGAVCGEEIECPWHRSRFDVRTGKVTHGPAKVDLKTFETRVEGDIVYVRVEGAGKPENRPAPERRNPAEAPERERGQRPAGAEETTRRPAVEREEFP